jgi:nucleoid DNA-binding protein
MNRNDLQELVRQQLGGTATPMAAQLALDAVLQAIGQGLARDSEVKLAKFGTFKVSRRAPRRLLLPGSRQSLTLPQRQVIQFKSSASSALS